MDGTSREAGSLICEVQSLCAEASSLRRTLAELVHLVTRRYGFRRAVAIGRFEFRFAGAAEGVSDEAVDVLLERIREGEVSFPSPGPRGGISVLGAGEDSPLPDGDSFLVLPFGVYSAPFAGALLVEAEAGDRRSAELTEVLRKVSPSLARVAEIESLRETLDESRTQAKTLETVFDALPDPVVVLDPDHRVLLANRRADDLFHLSPGDSAGRRHAVHTNNLFFSAFRAKSLLEDGSERELLLVDPEYGEDLVSEATVLKEGSGLNGRFGAVYILRDITDLKKAAGELEIQYGRSVAAEHRLRRESERLNVIIENAGVPILVIDNRSDIVLMNREAERLFELGTSTSTSSLRFHDVRSNDAAITGLISDFLLQADERREEELQLVDPDGAREFPVRATLTKLTTRRGEPMAVVSVLHDLTNEVENQRLAEELKQLNEELEQRIRKAIVQLAERNQQLEAQREELLRASRLKTEFLAMMSHELRTPLNSILGHGSLLREGILGTLTQEQHEALDKTHAASEHLLSLINDILDLSKVEAGKISLSLVGVELDPFVAKLMETIRSTVERTPLDFRMEVADDLPPVLADATRLRQVLLNLLSNAVKFTEEGAVTIRVLKGDRDDRVRFEVEDTGVGIAEENLDTIFEGFRQVDHFLTRAKKGTGLGLTISQRLIALMGGSLRVESEVGVGSLFWFELPTEHSVLASRSEETDAL